MSDEVEEKEKFDTLMIFGGAKVVLPTVNMEETWDNLKRTVDAYFNKNKEGPTT